MGLLIPCTFQHFLPLCIALLAEPGTHNSNITVLTHEANSLEMRLGLLVTPPTLQSVCKLCICVSSVVQTRLYIIQTPEDLNSLASLKMTAIKAQLSCFARGGFTTSYHMNR